MKTPYGIEHDTIKTAFLIAVVIIIIVAIILIKNKGKRNQSWKNI